MKVEGRPVEDGEGGEGKGRYWTMKLIKLLYTHTNIMNPTILYDYNAIIITL